MITVTLYHRGSNDENQQVLEFLEELQKTVPHRLVQIDIESDPLLLEAFAHQSPLVEVGPYRLRSPITKTDLQVALGAASDRARHLDSADPAYKERVERGKKITGADRFTYWFSTYYIILFNVLAFLYVGLPFFAPVLMKADLPAPARVIYTIYSPLCHQLAFRSWFIFGEQPYYPRALAQIPDVLTYEELAGREQADLFNARGFIGNPEVGYKVALCQRDVAIYGAIFLFGVIYAISGRRFKIIPWYFWVVLGLVPIGLDGVSQLPSLMGSLAPDWIPIRESTPFLRSITGGMFGLMTAWYVYPLIDESMRETRRMIARKMAVVEQTQDSPR